VVRSTNVWLVITITPTTISNGTLAGYVAVIPTNNAPPTTTDTVAAKPIQMVIARTHIPIPRAIRLFQNACIISWSDGVSGSTSSRFHGAKSVRRSSFTEKKSNVNRTTDRYIAIVCVSPSLYIHSKKPGSTSPPLMCYTP